MAEFEELRLTVNLVDNASAGLQRIRSEIGQLTTTANAMTTALASASSGMTNLGTSAGRAAPGVRTLEQEMKALQHSAGDATRGLVTMGTAFRGLSALPQIAAGMRDMAGGVSGVAESLAVLAPHATHATLAIGGLAVGVIGLGAAVVAYGVTVFKFAKEMDQLSRTAKTLGMSFAEVKNAVDVGRRYGQTAEGVLGNMAGLQKAVTDLAQGGSKLREELVGKGLDPNLAQSIRAGDRVLETEQYGGAERQRNLRGKDSERRDADGGGGFA